MKLIYRLRKWRSKWRRAKRLMWSSPGEVRLIEMFGGRVVKVRRLENRRNQHYLTPFYSVGPYFRRHGIKREVRIGLGKDAKFIDFASYAGKRKKAIEVLSKRWHNSVIEDAERKRALERLGWSVLYIHYEDIKRIPWQVRKKVMKFLAKG